MDTAARARQLALAGIEVRATQSYNTGNTGGQTAHEPAGSPKGGQFTSNPSGGGSTSGYKSILPPASAYSSGGGGKKAAAPSVPANTPQAPTEPRTMKPGDFGEDVRYAQYAMNLLGFKVAQDGQYGPETEAAVRQIQERLGAKKPNGHLSSSDLHKLQDAVRLSPCIGGGQRDLGLEAQWEARDVEDVDDDEADDVLDEDAEALIAALEEFMGDGIDARSQFDPALHPRGPGGKFRTVLGRIVGALDAWKKGEGSDHPLIDAGFTKEQLRSAAKQLNIPLRRGTPKNPLESEEIEKAILDRAREAHIAAKAAAPHLPGAPADHRRFTIQLGGEHKSAFSDLKPAEQKRRRDLLADVAAKDGQSFPAGYHEDLEKLQSRGLVKGKAGALTGSDSSARVHYAPTTWHLTDKGRAELAAKPTGGTATDVGIFGNPTTGKLSLYRESDTGKRTGRAIKSFDDMAGLEAWARESGHTELADYAKAEQVRTGGSKAPTETPATGHDALAAPRWRLTDINDDYVPPTDPGKRRLFDALRFYRGSSAEVQRMARDPKAQLGDAERTAEVKSVVDRIDQVMADSPLDRSVALWRGARGQTAFGPRDSWAHDLTGQEWTERAFTSTSASRGSAEDFARRQDGVLMRLVVPKGTGAAQISGRGHEEEVLLQRGLQMRVVRDHGDVDGVRTVDVEVIPSAKAEQARTGGATAAPETAAKKAAGAKPDAQQAKIKRIQGDIRKAYDQLRGRTDLPKSTNLIGNPEMGVPFGSLHDAFREGGWVFLADIRDALGEKYNRADVDEALRGMRHESGVRLIPVAARHGLAQRDHDSQLHLAKGVADTRVDMIQIGGRPQARTGGAAKVAPAKLRLTEQERRWVNGTGGRAGSPIPIPLVQNAQAAGLEVPTPDRWDQMSDRERAEFIVAARPAAKVAKFDPANPLAGLEGLTPVQKRAALRKRGLSKAEIDALAPLEKRPRKAARALEMLGAIRALGHDVTPGHDELHHYWTRGPGLAKWAESPKPWTTLVAHLTKYVGPEKAKVYASKWFEEVFHFAAGSDLNRVTHGHPPRGHRIGPG